MNISLTPELEQYVNKQVATGLYHSSSEVIRAALRLLLKSDPDQGLENYKMWLNQEIKIGLDQASRNALIPADQVFKNFKTLRKRMKIDGQK